MQMIIVDPVTPHPYSSATLRDRPLGGTEATVIRIAERMDAIVLQHNRSDDDGRYRRMTDNVAPSMVVVLREAAIALDMAARYPHTPQFLWLHDLAGPSTDRGRKLLSFAARLAAAMITIICVSDFHAHDVELTLAALPAAARPKVIRIYNPVDVVAVQSRERVYDPNKLVFFSSPHKGLEYTLHVFAHLRSKNKHLQLYIANPGYLPSLTQQWPGVINLGAVPHHIILEHVQSALCTFYPNYIYPETFGLALAESNALGVPVLTHPIGAATEVLCGEGQLAPIPSVRAMADSVFWRWPMLRRVGEAVLGQCGYLNVYEDRLRQWQDGARPAVSGRPAFEIDAVAAAWQVLAAAPAQRF